MKKLIEAKEDRGAVIILAGDHQGREAYVSELKELIATLGLESRVHSCRPLLGHGDGLCIGQCDADCLNRT